MFEAQYVTEPGRRLHRSFLQLGDMTGKTLREIISVVGAPQAASSIGAGKTLLQWQATGFYIAILFTGDGRFEKITSESVNCYPPADGAQVAGAVIGIVVVIGIVLAVIASHC
jgi:hypothetical protein